MKTIDEVIKLCEDDFCGKSIREILKEWSSEIVDRCVEVAEAFTELDDTPKVSRGSILNVKNEIK